MSVGAAQQLPKPTNELMSGVVASWNSGYGFIKPDSGERNVFVHQTQIKMKGFRSLLVGEKVEFKVELKPDGRTQAIDVTGPGGAEPKGAPRGMDQSMGMGAMGMGAMGAAMGMYQSPYGYAQPYWMQSQQYAGAAAAQPQAYYAAAAPVAASAAASSAPAANPGATTQAQYTGSAYSSAEDYYKAGPNDPASAGAAATTHDPYANNSAAVANGHQAPVANGHHAPPANGHIEPAVSNGHHASGAPSSSANPQNAAAAASAGGYGSYQPAQQAQPSARYQAY